MTDQTPPPSLDELEARLRDARRSAESSSFSPTQRKDEAGNGWLGIAFRIGAELVAAMVVGVGGGLVIDRWLGTSPWGLIVMFVLGSAAAMLNVYRAVNGMGYAVGYRRPDAGANSGGGTNSTPAKDEGEGNRGH
ncbi:AtpZ/AtpI family protein [Nitrospirillum sp. BR 11163]|uniref:AtpZ/AtpI family protein n=1 Tax=Nitrospirillum sp. BR 11163 TaxID=3104323 RepID=UPI002AFE550A|nr:AtpZ/AtpI family protein [Nitrospirillum sp. BR 11163]MEA1675749.1 AtpZ/AtpI family protein [Nitrospirillum sp. BR 11163]